MANSLSVTQVSKFIANITKQTTGINVPEPVTTADFVNVAQTALLNGLDPVMNAINTVLSRTIFSTRPYDSKLRIMEYDATRWGAHTRKIKFVLSEPEDNNAYKYPVLYDATQANPLGNGESVDEWKIKKPEVLQTNFYGFSTLGDHITTFRNQLDVAFRGPEELGAFISSRLLHWKNQRELWIENFKRGILLNMIGSLAAENAAGRVVHLITDYNKVTGLALDSESVFQPDNFKPFMYWAYSKFAQYSDLMTDYTTEFQTNITGKTVAQNTPKRDQRLIIYSSAIHQLTAQVLSDTYNPNYLSLPPYETVNYWQNIKEPMNVDVLPVYTGTNGILVKPTDSVKVTNLFALMYDVEALGMSILHNRFNTTHMNADGEYWNTFWKMLCGGFNDITEKSVLFLLD